MPTHYTVSEAVRSLPDVIIELPATGPVILTRYDKPVAQISTYQDPQQQQAQQAAQMAVYARTFDRARTTCDHLDGTDEALVEYLASLHLNTLGQINGFLDELDSFNTRHGAKLDGWDADNKNFTPGDSHLVRVARMLFTTDEAAVITDAGHDLGDWASAIADTHQQARQRGDNTRLPLSDGYDDDTGEAAFLTTALHAGLTPDTFALRAAELAAHGIRLEDLGSALGTAALPLDLLAADGRAAQHLAEMQKYGLSREDAATVLRHLVTRTLTDQPDDAQAIARYGSTPAFNVILSSAAAIASAGGNGSAQQLIDLLTWQQNGPRKRSTRRLGAPDGYSLDLIRRATDEGLIPQQWVPILEAIGDRSYGRHGILPLELIAEAADRKADVRGWDDNSHARRRSSYRGRDRYSSDKHDYDLTAQPWATLYGDADGHIIDLAAAGVSAAIADQAWKLFHRHAERWSGEDMVTDLIALCRAGLTLPLASEMAQMRRNGGPAPSVALVLDMLEHGLTVGAVQEAKRVGWGFDDLSVQQQLWDQQRGTASEFLTGWWERETPVLAEMVPVCRVWDKQTRDWHMKQIRAQVPALAFEALTLLSGDRAKLHHGHAGALASFACWLNPPQQINQKRSASWEVKGYNEKVSGDMRDEFLRAVHDEVLVFAADNDSDAGRYRRFLARMLPQQTAAQAA